MSMELSVVIPCLNESETIGTCIKKAKNQISKLNISAEIIVSDNGSTDGSVEISKKLGAKIFFCAEKGYGSAVTNGIKNSSGKYILIADADDSYNFDDLPIFYNKIRKGYDLVQGCRMPSGGGEIEKGAMPLSHRLIGNPLFTLICKLFFSLPFNDVYCGMKIIRNDFFKNENFFSKGMVFCLEILIKSKVLRAKTCEIPIRLFKDGRIKAKSHLNTIKDGLRTFKFILICCPKWLYFFPFLFFFLITPAVYYTLNNIINKPKYEILLIILLLLFLSFQFFMLGLFSSLRAKDLGLYNGNWLNLFFKFFNLKLSLLISLSIFIFSIFFLYKDFIFISKEFDFIFFSFLIFFSISLIANSLAISLLSLDK
jgi:glycosyltransferase involved in cell wall biosynthesis